FEDGVRLGAVHRAYGLEHAIAAELLVGDVPRLGDAVAAHHYEIAGLELLGGVFVFRRRQQAEHRPARFEPADAVLRDDERRLLAGVAVAELARRRRDAVTHGGEPG